MNPLQKNHNGLFCFGIWQLTNWNSLMASNNNKVAKQAKEESSILSVPIVLYNAHTTIQCPRQALYLGPTFIWPCGVVLDQIQLDFTNCPFEISKPINNVTEQLMWLVCTGAVSHNGVPLNIQSSCIICPLRPKPPPYN